MTMRTIVVFGASGLTGRQLVKQSLERGFRVRAFVRNADTLPIRDKNLEMVEGDARNRSKVYAAVEGADAVLSVLGTRSLKRSAQILVIAAEFVIDAMKKYQVKRIIILTDCGLSDPRDHSSLLFKVGVKLTELLMPPIVNDARRHVELLKLSGLDWTIVRVPFLTNGHGAGHYNAGYIARSSNVYISRSDVAHFMLEQLGSEQYIHGAPYICSIWPFIG